MEFIGITRFKIGVSPEQRREALRVFGQWQPPEGLNLKLLYFSADGSRSIGVIETDSAALLTSVAERFSDYIDFEWIPVLPAQEGAAIAAEAQAWVDQVKGG